MNRVSTNADSLTTASSTIFRGGPPPAFDLSGAEKLAAAGPASPKANLASSDSTPSAKLPMLVSHKSGDSAARPSVAPGAMWPTGTGEDSLSNRFRQATPPELRDLAPQGMKLPVDVGYNIQPPTKSARHAAGDISRISFMNFGALAGVLLHAYVTGKGRDHELAKNVTNKLLEALPDSAERSQSPARGFMQRNADQIRRDVQQHIAHTGETSGQIRGVTDWGNSFDLTYMNSLGWFSAKLLYDIGYVQKRDGSIEISGRAALAVQDLYDFTNKTAPTIIPPQFLPKDFTSRPNHKDREGYLTDAAFATLQKEGIASPFYVYGVSDTARMEMNLRPGEGGMWRIRR